MNSSTELRRHFWIAPSWVTPFRAVIPLTLLHFGVTFFFPHLVPLRVLVGWGLDPSFQFIKSSQPEGVSAEF